MNDKSQESLLELWARWVPQLARKRHLHALTLDEAAREFETAQEVPLAEEEFESIIEQIVSDELSIWDSPEVASVWQETIDSTLGSAALSDGLVQENETIDEAEDDKENHNRLEGGDDPSETPGSS